MVVLDERSVGLQVPPTQVEIVEMSADGEVVFGTLVYVPGEYHTITVTLRNNAYNTQTVLLRPWIGRWPYGTNISRERDMYLPEMEVSIRAGGQETISWPFVVPPLVMVSAQELQLKVWVGVTLYELERIIWWAATKNWGASVSDFVHPNTYYRFDSLGLPFVKIGYEQVQTLGPPIADVISNPAVVAIFLAGHGGNWAMKTTGRIVLKPDTVTGYILLEDVAQWMAGRPPMKLTVTLRYGVGCLPGWYRVFTGQPPLRDAEDYDIVPGSAFVGGCSLDFWWAGHKGANTVFNILSQTQDDPYLSYYDAHILANIQMWGDEQYSRFFGDQALTAAHLKL